MTKRPELAAEMMSANAGLHPNQASWHVGDPSFYLATRPLLPQHDRTALIKAYDVERVLADINADYRDSAPKYLSHGVLLLFGGPPA